MREPLRFITCGSVDDGKSTLIGRLLWESKQVFEDHLPALERDSTRYGTQGSALDLALLLDGLQAEREQSITIDVAYRFFATPHRRFLVADCPGHEQYTCNMATGASNSELALLVVNAKHGLTTQTHRHARIVSLLGIRHLVMVVNKMDLVSWDQAVFDGIVSDFKPLIHDLDFATFQAIPVSALHGDNITQRSEAAIWYEGSALLPYLETIEVTEGDDDKPFRMAVQWVNRPNQNFRGFCGRIASGTVRKGDRVRVLPSGRESTIRSIVVWQGEIESATKGDSITLCLADEIDICRGDLIVTAQHPTEQSDQFEAKVLCLAEEGVMPGRSYLFQLSSNEAAATITSIRCLIDVKTGARLAARSIQMNDIAVVNLSTDRRLPFESYMQNRQLGSFILVDRLTSQTVGAGMIDFALRRAANIHWQSLEVSKAARAKLKHQKPVCIWFTGLSGSGKSTIANLLEKRLFAEGLHTYILDGDNVRHGLNCDLGFTEADRVENIRRVTETARLFIDAGLIVLVAFISPFRAERDFARSRFAPGEFIEVFVDTPLSECERRDPKGLYAKARNGKLSNFTGIDSRYDAPLTPEVTFDTMTLSPEDCVQKILQALDLS